MDIILAPQLETQKSLNNIMLIDLPNPAQRITLKFGDIVQEEVDIIVNSANKYLLHNEGVAAAIHKASSGIVQSESNKIIHTKSTIPTGDVVVTAAGGALKCKHVIHAVGPATDQHKNQFGMLLVKACANAMNAAVNFKACMFHGISSN